MLCLTFRRTHDNQCLTKLQPETPQKQGLIHLEAGK